MKKVESSKIEHMSGTRAISLVSAAVFDMAVKKVCVKPSETLTSATEYYQTETNETRKGG